MAKYIIVGGVAGGMSTAARLRRLDEKAEIVVFEKGPYVSYANCGLPYYISGVINDSNELTLRTPESLKNRFNIDARVNSEVTAIDRSLKNVSVKDGSKTYHESYDKLVLSPGAAPVIPALPGINSPRVFTLRTIPDTFAIKNFIESNNIKNAVVIGGGYIGLEMAENLRHISMDVTVIEALPHVLNVFDDEMACIIENDMAQKGIRLVTGRSVESFRDTEGTVETAISGGEVISSGIVILSIGVKPDIKLAKESGIECARGIIVNDFLQTSDSDIYAVGDAIEVLNPVLGKKMVIPLAGPANKQGRMAADNIAGGNREKYHGTFGSSVLKFFDLTAAICGPSSKALRAENIPFESAIVHTGNHADYYPGASTISLKLLFAPDTGRILGAQAVGADMAEKKIDIISAFMQKQGTIHDLTEFEQCYAPPFSSAKDTVNMAGFVAENIITGKIKPVVWESILKNRGDYFLLDVRSKEEFSCGAASGAVNIPVDDLRQNLPSLDKNRKIAVYCGVGVRSYIAVRILTQNGFNDVYNISGGFHTYFNMLKQG
jgi:NADPH-dependent 2,4-dienoyl-CoA reductase/sulfur reductase-like enzyme/rhodanese-related sulfurtransferase